MGGCGDKQHVALWCFFPIHLKNSVCKWVRREWDDLRPFTVPPQQAPVYTLFSLAHPFSVSPGIPINPDERTKSNIHGNSETSG